ncbi:hypothetical protein BASA50_011312 [Batrachochytrium salamandrivorans]|uniref:Uncharacterized protein n=1 Tax=Batrachochytrium salamandrivorans TaxID=1357716 RepID=A0ABQ8EWC7_9FUNG|nr:hypothetical protein BASA50_011312 [Batrachochytrium salamandrivorans]
MSGNLITDLDVIMSDSPHCPLAGPPIADATSLPTNVETTTRSTRGISSRALRERLQTWSIGRRAARSLQTPSSSRETHFSVSGALETPALTAPSIQRGIQQQQRPSGQSHLDMSIYPAYIQSHESRLQNREHGRRTMENLNMHIQQIRHEQLTSQSVDLQRPLQSVVVESDASTPISRTSDGRSTPPFSTRRPYGSGRSNVATNAVAARERGMQVPNAPRIPYAVLPGNASPSVTSIIANYHGTSVGMRTLHAQHTGGTSQEVSPRANLPAPTPRTLFHSPANPGSHRQAFRPVQHGEHTPPAAQNHHQTEHSSLQAATRSQRNFLHATYLGRQGATVNEPISHTINLPIQFRSPYLSLPQARGRWTSENNHQDQNADNRHNPISIGEVYIGNVHHSTPFRDRASSTAHLGRALNQDLFHRQQIHSARQQQPITSPPNRVPHGRLHPSFRLKTVCSLECRYCDQEICRRGMKAILLADTKVELYSTDLVLPSGNVVGYHITQPCDACLGACNNGHFWMFHSSAVEANERMDVDGHRTLLWEQLSDAEIEESRGARVGDRPLVCR